MSIELDERRVSMLAEMGIRLFQPDPLAGHAADTLPEPSRHAQTQPTLAAGIVQAPVLSAPAAFTVPGRGVDTMDWDPLAAAVAGCRACKLCDGRRNTVFGVGDQRADWMVVGDAPVENEDAQGEPFAGEAGQLLDSMLRAVGADRRQGAYITNVLKCRPPGNRNPEPAELAQCDEYLRRQVALVQPRVILVMGRFAVQAMLKTSEPIGKLRGRAHQYNGVPVVVTLHPAYLLRNLPEKAKAWTDLCLAMAVSEDGGPSDS